MLTPLRTRPRASPDLRCAVCHDALVASVPCPGCATLLHPECRGLLRGACPTRGCVGRAAVLAPVSRRGWPGALILLAWTVGGMAALNLARSGSGVLAFDCIMSLVMWGVAGPLLCVIALDLDGRRSD